MPGRVNTVIRSPTCPLETPSSRTMVGKAGVMLEVPSTHQRHAPQNVEVVVFIDPANTLVSFGLRSHDRRIYQVVRSEVGSGTLSTLRPSGPPLVSMSPFCVLAPLGSARRSIAPGSRLLRLWEGSGTTS